MKKAVLTYGLLSGVVSIALMLATTRYLNTTDFRKGDVLGYTSIFLTALLVFFGVRSYRESEVVGKLTFGRAFAVGVLISLVSSVCYVIAFQIIYFKAMPGIGEKYAACMVERARTRGASRSKIEEATRQAQQFKQLYDRPATNAALTFAQSFPVGLVSTLLSASILRRKEEQKGRDQ